MNAMQRNVVLAIGVGLSLLVGCPPDDTKDPNAADCGELDESSVSSNGEGTLSIDVAGGPADASLLLRVGNRVYVGVPAEAGAEPTTYEFSGLPSGTFDAEWEISGCEDEAVPIDGPSTVTIP